MSTGSNGARRIVSALRPSIPNPRVCRSCQETLVRRNYATATASAETEAPSTAAKSAPATDAPSLQPKYLIQAGMVVSRAPQITRDLTPFEKSFFFYQKRLNERLVLPFTKYFYFSPKTPADQDWKRKVAERQTPSRDIGKYSAYGKDAWNDELFVGAEESEPENMKDVLVEDAESIANATSQDTSKKAEIPRPASRVTEADKKNDVKSLNRLLQRTLYLLVQNKEGAWEFPSSLIKTHESVRTAAERSLADAAGVNMHTWTVGFHPVGHHVYTAQFPKKDEAGVEIAGDKTFFMKSRIMAGQADLAGKKAGLKDFKWLSKEEIQTHVSPLYWSNIKNMLPAR